MLTPRDQELFARYLDGLASEAEDAELSGRLREDAEAAAAFARASRLEAALGDHFRQEKGASDVAAVLERLGEEKGEKVNVPFSPPWRRAAFIAAGVAAAILIALSPALWLRPAKPPNQVVDGKVLGEGTELAAIPDGTHIVVPAGAPAAIRLGDGSRATLEPSTDATIHGPSDGLRQLVELARGGGSFQVVKGIGRFQVRTPVGNVTVLGTEFSVRLLPPDHPDGKGEEGMRARGMLLAVAVLTGAVQVQVGERAVVLGVGQSQVFAGDGERGPTTSRIGGELTNVGTDSITIVQRGDSGERTKTLAVDGQTKVVIESDQTEQVTGEGGAPVFRVKLVDGTLADLKVGRRVTITCTEDGKAILIVLHRVKPRREGGEGEGTPRVEKPRREGGDREGEVRVEKPRREGGEGEGTPRVEKPRREGGEGEGKVRIEKPRREGGDREGEGKVRLEKPRVETREGGEGEVKARTEKPRREGGEGDAGPKASRITGELTRVGDGAITVAARGDGGEQSQTLTVDAATKVGIEGQRAEGGGEGADPVKRPVLLAGTLGDLKVGQRVSVMYSADNKALKILIHRPNAPKREGEGGERKRFRAPEGGGDRKPPRDGGDAKPRKEGGDF